MKRVYSIDAFRGFDMLFLAGLSSVIASICLLSPGGAESWLYRQMDHAAWDGFHLYDTIFPTFLFISGLSWPFSYASKKSKGVGRSAIYFKIAERFVVLFLLGLVYNGLLANLHLWELRYYSVLGRIGFCWAVSSILYINFSKKVRAVIAVTILIGYYLLLRFVSVPGSIDPFSPEGNLVGYIDGGRFDPEGLLSNLPAIVTAMLGVFTGELLRERKYSDGDKLLRMVGSALLMVGIGLFWGRWFPINKALWSSTFVLVAGGFALGVFSLFYFFIDVLGYRRWAFPFKVVGMNSITIYLAMEIIPFGIITTNVFGGLSDLCPSQWQPLVHSLGYTIICWLFLYFLYRKNVFLKV